MLTVCRASQVEIPAQAASRRVFWVLPNSNEKIHGIIGMHTETVHAMHVRILSVS